MTTLMLEPLSITESDSLTHYEQQIAEGMDGFIKTGSALLAIRGQRLYRSTHRSFADYLADRWPQIGSRRQADRLINAALVEDNLRPMGLGLTNERQARELANLSPDQQRDVFTAALHATGGKAPTAAQIALQRSRGASAALASPEGASVATASPEGASAATASPEGASAATASPEGASVATASPEGGWLCVVCGKEQPEPRRGCIIPPDRVCTGCAMVSYVRTSLDRQLDALKRRVEKLDCSLKRNGNGYSVFRGNVLHIYAGDLDELERQICRMESSPPAALMCTCGWQAPEFFSGQCEVCHMIRTAEQQSDPEMMSWYLSQARQIAKKMPDAIQNGRLALIRDIGDAHHIDVFAPVIGAAITVANTTKSTRIIAQEDDRRYQHAAELLASFVESIPDNVVRLVAVLTVPDYDLRSGTDPREELWTMLQCEARDNPDLLRQVLD